MDQRAGVADDRQMVSRAAPPDKGDIPCTGFPAHGVKVRVEDAPHKSLVRERAVGLLSPPVRHAEPAGNTDHQADTVDPDTTQAALVLIRGAYPTAGFGYYLTPIPGHLECARQCPYQARTARP